ncbi:hypothetical protein [Leucobacter salsicius]|uniref:hypothetical protein n=1 Tax=Leucobacter salsicius TaxID=664638 RepID=UPI0018DC6996|nr:hypothetical protein [Leucobacter salsicius]
MTQLHLLGSPSSFPPLPTRWDGDVVSWDNWQEHIRTSADFHGDQPTCEGCGTDQRPHWATGSRHPSQGEVIETTTRHPYKAPWGTTYQTPHTRYTPATATIQFHATRCGWCGHTEVFDNDSQELWTLDDTDYNTTGSQRPTTTKHPAALAAEEDT